ncbi:hypothetical protein EJ05DRAFT_297264 [Pseudovirgaria hyperparasitica]|uniref:Uncharacterized protein n=1 Tax=Pseudovirgaria hyperparasitica TaxID=470096 RepID=A0A6A6VRV5_9PEZI|nr:uncharacterized protein EJ05DRAFT_297264 [Pseudovirgaria hyperparasitica]KAF2752516.1 hypothetical protein EJ05DRAFT_297264 [Pseudovirgaria hyperparasitica]
MLQMYQSGVKLLSMPPGMWIVLGDLKIDSYIRKLTGVTSFLFQEYVRKYHQEWKDLDKVAVATLKKFFPMIPGLGSHYSDYYELGLDQDVDVILNSSENRQAHDVQDHTPLIELEDAASAISTEDPVAQSPCSIAHGLEASLMPSFGSELMGVSPADRELAKQCHQTYYNTTEVSAPEVSAPEVSSRPSQLDRPMDDTASIDLNACLLENEDSRGDQTIGTSRYQDQGEGAYRQNSAGERPRPQLTPIEQGNGRSSFIIYGKSDTGDHSLSTASPSSSGEQFTASDLEIGSDAAGQGMADHVMQSCTATRLPNRSAADDAATTRAAPAMLSPAGRSPDVSLAKKHRKPPWIIEACSRGAKRQKTIANGSFWSPPALTTPTRDICIPSLQDSGQATSVGSDSCISVDHTSMDDETLSPRPSTVMPDRQRQRYTLSISPSVIEHHEGQTARVGREGGEDSSSTFRAENGGKVTSEISSECRSRTGSFSPSSSSVPQSPTTSHKGASAHDPNPGTRSDMGAGVIKLRTSDGRANTATASPRITVPNTKGNSDTVSPVHIGRDPSAMSELNSSSIHDTMICMEGEPGKDTAVCQLQADDRPWSRQKEQHNMRLQSNPESATQTSYPEAEPGSISVIRRDSSESKY